MAKEYSYLTSCISSTYELISSMNQQAKQVSYRTAQKHILGLSNWALSMGYMWNAKHGLTLKNDWHVGYYKSVYDGKPCYFIRHSAIEHIFTKE